ncbi:MAG: oligosaccharide flippase family protein [Nitrosomonas sp.]|nr:oligosaccharide flippase family protein [Nitrosomonas sp.]MBY0579310.1 oligosaccharide flippase family protein [Burkholderiales bacterium]
MRELWGNIAHTSVAKIYSLLVGVVTLFLTARLLGPEGRGQVAAITTWVSLFTTFAFLSLGQVAIHRMSDEQGQMRFGNLLGSLLLMASILTFAGWLVALGLYWVSSNGAFKGLPVLPLIVGFFALPFMIWEQYGSALLMGLGRVRIYNRYQIIGRTASILAVLVLVGGFGLGVTGVLGGGLLGQVIVAIGGIGFMLAFARNKGLACRADKCEIKVLLAGGAKLHLNAIGTFLFTSVNILILNNYRGAEQTGYFQLATQLLNVLMIIPQAACMVIYGKVASLGPNGAWPENKQLLIHLTGGMIALSALAALLAPWGITLLAGKAFQPAVEPFQWMLLGVVGMTFSTVMAPQWIGRGYFWQAAGLTFLVGGINLAANLLLIPRYGMQGAALAFIGTYAFSIIGNGAMAWHCAKVSRYALLSSQNGKG